MLTLLATMILVAVGSVILSFGFLYKQDDPANSQLKFYQVLAKNPGVRIPLWLVGSLFVGYAVYGQFM